MKPRDYIKGEGLELILLCIQIKKTDPFMKRGQEIETGPKALISRL